jgi:hypothetical protein
MTFELTNQTPLAAMASPHTDHHGQAGILVVAKGTWRLRSGKLAAAEQQVGLNKKQLMLRLGDIVQDELQLKVLKDRLDEEIVWLDHDLSPPKSAFDVIVAGYVTPPANYREASVDAGIRIGGHTASLRAHAPRYWDAGLIGTKAKPIAPIVTRLPLTYAFADWTSGFPNEVKPGALALLPWIEASDCPAQYRKHASKVAGFGFWPENARHRQPLAGTYDDAWKQKRSPLLPTDFNPRFYNSAHPDLQLPTALKAGTPIRLVHLAEEQVIDTVMPTLSLAVQSTNAGGSTGAPTELKPDTLTIEPEHDRLCMIWRAFLPTGIGANAIRNLRLYKSSELQPA